MNGRTHAPSEDQGDAHQNASSSAPGGPPTTDRPIAPAREIFDAIDDGYCVLQVLADGAGCALDYRFIDANPAFERHTGLASPVGKTARELVPGLEDHWVETYGRVAMHREATRFEADSPVMGRRFQTHAFPIGAPEDLLVGLVFRDVTAQRAVANARLEAERQLRESEARLRLAADAARFGTYDADLQHGRTLWSEQLFSLMGMDPPPVPRQPMHEAPLDPKGLPPTVHEDDVPRVAAAIQAAIDPAGTGRIDIEHRVVPLRGEGGVRWVRLVGETIFEPDPRRPGGKTAVRAIGSCIDVTHRKQAEHRAIAGEARYRGLFNAIDQAFEIVELIENDAGETIDYRYIAANPAFERHTGVRRVEGRTAREVFPGIEPLWAELYARVARTGEPERFSEHMASLDRWFEGSAFATGEPGRVGVLFSDVTEHRRHADKLKQSEERYRLLVDSAQEYAIFMTDPDDRIVSWNPGAERIFGWTEAEAVGGHAGMTFTPEDRARGVQQRELDAAAENGSAADDRWHVRKDGQRFWASGVVTALQDNDRVRGFARVLRDNTEPKRHEQQMRRVMAELNHRVKNTLATVDALARQTMRATPDPETFGRTFGARLRSMARAHGLLTMTDWAGADLVDLVREELAARVVDPSRVTAEGPVCRLSPDAALSMAMVVHELATNAAKYGALSTAGGSVSVRWRVENEDDDDASTLVMLWTERGGPPAAQGRDGFGHRLLRELVEQGMDGRVSLDFGPDGLDCRLTLPWLRCRRSDAEPGAAPGTGPEPCASTQAQPEAQPEPQPEAQPEAQPQPHPEARADPGTGGNADVRAAGLAPPRLGPTAPAQAGPRPLRVLLVEDNPLIASVGKQILSDAGMEVVGPAATVADARRLIARHPLDVAALDVNLGTETSLPLASELRQAGMPVVLLTGYETADLPPQLAGLRVIHKPYEPEALVAALRDTVGAAG